jgi:hypothetical protein
MDTLRNDIATSSRKFGSHYQHPAPNFKKSCRKQVVCAISAIRFVLGQNLLNQTQVLNFISRNLYMGMGGTLHCTEKKNLMR